MLACKSHFPFCTMIELYAMLIRSTEEIMTLLNSSTTSFSTNSNLVNYMIAIIYYRELN